MKIKLLIISNIYRLNAINVMVRHSFTYIPTQGRAEVNIRRERIKL